MAKAIRIAWDESSGMDRVTWAATSRTAAKAAREFYGLTKSAEKGAVGKVAAHLLRRTRECDESATCAACIDREMCDDYQSLIALGVGATP